MTEEELAALKAAVQYIVERRPNWDTIYEASKIKASHVLEVIERMEQAEKSRQIYMHQLDEIGRNYDEKGCLCDNPGGEDRPGAYGHYTETCQLYKAQKQLKELAATHDTEEYVHEALASRELIKEIVIVAGRLVQEARHHREGQLKSLPNLKRHIDALESLTTVRKKMNER